MRIALFQMAAVAGDVAANLDTIAKAAAEAARGGADLLIAPELATTGYGVGDAIRDLAEPADGRQVARLSAIARANGLAVIAGFAERDGDHIYNSAVFTDGESKPLVYRKAYLYGDYERALFTPAPPSAPIARWRDLNIGMLICYDVEFPENVRRAAMAGADLVAVATALPICPQAGFISGPMIQVRAFENHVFVAYANLAGDDGRFTYCGLSHLASPDGATQARATDAPTLLFADIRPGDFDASRETNPYLPDLRAGIARDGLFPAE